MSTVITIIIAAVLTNNFVLSKFYGCCPFLGVSKKLDSSIGMGLRLYSSWSVRLWSPIRFIISC